MNIELLFPPQWTPLNPHFSLAALNGHLRRRGAEVTVSDLNLRFYRQILTRRYLELSRKRALNAHAALVPRLALELRRGHPGILAARFERLESYLYGGQSHLFERVAEQLEDAVALFRDRRRFYEPAELVPAYLTIDKALELISLPFYPHRVRFNDFTAHGLPLTTEAVFAFTTDPEENLCLPFLQEQARQVARRNPQVVGISINAHAQLLPGLTLARLLKAVPERRFHLTLGGNHFARIREGLLKSPSFLERFADSVILGEGEQPLDALLDCLAEGGELGQVPGLVHLDREGRVAWRPSTGVPRLDQRAPMSLEGLPLEEYFSPELVLSTRTSTGCYWRKCTFCDTDFGVCADHRSLDHLADEMADLKARHGVEDFCFIDEAVVPGQMDRLGEKLAERGTAIHWYGNARLETSFTPERLERLRDTGLTMLMWGLESGSDRVMGLINKGIKLDRRMDILRNADRAGVWNFCYIFFGFPSETEEEGMDTIRMLLDHREVIHSYGRSVFTLNKQARMQTDPATIGVLEMVADPEELSTTLHYVSVTGNGRQQAMELSERCKLMCSVAYGEPLWMYLRFREVIHLYLKRRGRQFVLDYRFSPEERERIHGLFQDRSRPLAAVLGADNP